MTNPSQDDTSRILVASRDINQARRICGLMEQEGHQVLRADNIAQTRSKISGFQPKALLVHRSWHSDLESILRQYPSVKSIIIEEDSTPAQPWPRITVEGFERTAQHGGNRSHLIEAVNALVKTPTRPRASSEVRQIALIGQAAKSIWHGGSVSEDFDLYSSGGELLSQMAEMTEAGGGSLFMCGQHALELVHSLDPGHAPEIIPRPLRTNSPFQKALYAGRPLLIGDLEEESRIDPSGYEGYGNNSLLVLPIIDDKGMVTAVCSLHNKLKTPFNEQDLQMASLMASMLRDRFAASEVLRNANLNENRYQALFEASPDAMFVKDTAGCFLQINTAMESLCGLKHHQIIGRKTDDIFGSKIGATMLQWDHEVLEKRVTLKKELPLSLGDSLRLFMVTTLPVMNAKGEAIGVSGFMRDISTHRSLEHQLRQSQKMEALGQLAGGVAHDFNNLLQTILAHAQFAERHMNEPENVRSDLRTILRASESAAALTRQLLAFGRRQVIQPSTIDFFQVVDGLMKMVRRVIGEDIELCVIPPAPGLRYVCADAGQIEQILMNLSVNARDAMPGGGEISISLHNMDLDEEYCSDRAWANPGKYVMMRFHDNGTGMDEDTVRCLFEPFFTTKEEGQGTGLGLSTVYGIVQQHKGLIDVQSKEGEGTTFKIFLPVADGTPEVETEQEMKDPLPITRGNETVLVAEDEVIVRELVERLLLDAGYKVIVTCDGQEAVDAYKTSHKKIDLVILDAVMPRLSGYGAYCKMYEINNSIPFIFCSGYAADTLVPSGKSDLPMPPVIQKPYRPAELLRVVRQQIDGINTCERHPE